MKIRPRIPIYLMGNKITAPLWYIDRYGGRTALLGWNLDKRYNYANSNLNLNDHRNAGDLNTVFRKNSAYTSTPGAISSDIQAFYNSDANGMSAEDFVKFYNENAAKIRSHWNLDRVYNASTAGDHNRLFKRMFLSRSNQQESPGSDYNIGYLEGKTKGGYDIQDIEGSSTWLRRMDLYENEFDPNNPDSNRLHEITLKDGTKAAVYKKANGDIALLPKTPQTSLQQLDKLLSIGTEVGGVGEKKQTPLGNSTNNDILGRLSGMIPGLISTGRLTGNLINNARVYDEVLKGIKPTLLLPYFTHRQVVGDEATKQAYYRRAIAGLTKAAQPFTSDADRQMAYMLEARRAGDELKAQGDLADNQEIRRTSDESNQHLWANTQRATEVANANIASLNTTAEKKHLLLAQKHSALWSSVDNYLKEIETRKRLLIELDNAYNKLIDLLDLENQLNNDPELNNITEQILKLHKEDGSLNTDDPTYKDLKLKLDVRRAQLTKLKLLGYRDINRKYSNNLYSFKSGSKITYKKDDKLLYKSTKDVVDHFRKMCRRYPDRGPKIIPLAPHPDGTRRKKYLTGGQFLAPFTIYTPAVGTGETSQTITLDAGTSSKSSQSSLKDSTLKDMLDLIKMFKDVKGIKVDVSSIYKNIASILQQAEVFGKEINSLQMASMYLRAMLQLNNVSRSKEIYDKAYERVVANDALNEIAINSLGYYAVQNKDSKEIEFVKDIDTEKYVPLTNSLLLTLREFSPNLSFEKGDEVMQQIIANGIGINKVGKEIKDLVSRLGSTDDTIEGLTKVESNKVKGGLLALSNPDKVKMLYALETAPNGDYKFTAETKNLVNQMKAALTYLENMLPENYKAIMNIHGGVRQNILMYLGSQSDESSKLQISPLTGKASDKSKDEKAGESSDGLKLDAATALITGKGYKSEIELNPGSSYAVNVQARFSEFLKPSGENMGAGTTMQEATESTIKGNLDWNKATIGGSRIIPTAYNQIILNNGEVVGVDLPVDPSNPDSPNFEILKQLENLDKQLKLNNIEDNSLNWKLVNDLCDRLNIPKKYDSSGKLNKVSWKRFAAFLVTTPDTALVNKNVILDMVGIANNLERDLYNLFIQQKTNNKNFELSDTFLGFGHRDELYKGTIFVPIKENIVAAAISSGQNIYMSLATDLEMRELGYDSNKVKSYKKSEYRL